MKTIFGILFFVCMSVGAQTTNVTVTINTNDLKFLPANISGTFQKAADQRLKDQQRGKLLKAFDKATPAQRRALLNWIESNLQ